MNDNDDMTDAEHDLMERIAQFSSLMEETETTDCEKIRSVLLSELGRTLELLKSTDNEHLARDIASADRVADAYNLLFQGLR